MISVNAERVGGTECAEAFSTQNRLAKDYIMNFCNELPRLGLYEIGFRQSRALGDEG